MTGNNAIIEAFIANFAENSKKTRFSCGNKPVTDKSVGKKKKKYILVEGAISKTVYLPNNNDAVSP